MPVTVAFDAGPTLGARTGIGWAVTMMHEHLAPRSDVALRPYACSFRGDLPAGTTRLPLPAAVAHRLWSRGQRPTVDRWLGAADVIHGTNYVVPPSRRPRLVSVYDCWFLRHPELAHPDVARAAAVLRRAVHAGAVVHACSQATAHAVRELLNTDRVVTIPLAALATIEVAAVAQPRLVGRDFVLAIGTIERRKNLAHLIDSWARISDTAVGGSSTLDLVIAGAEGDDIEAVRHSAARLDGGQRERLHLLGPVDEASKRWLLEHATVLAYPSLDEGFGFPLLEAMAAGVPIVASAVGSIPEVGADAVVTVSPTDGDELAEALLRVAGDSELRRVLIAAGQRQRTSFSWETTAAQLAALYAQMAEESHR